MFVPNPKKGKHKKKSESSYPWLGGDKGKEFIEPKRQIIRRGHIIHNGEWSEAASPFG